MSRLIMAIGALGAIAPAQQWALEAHTFGGGGVSAATATGAGTLELAATIGGGPAGVVTSSELWLTSGFVSSLEGAPMAGGTIDALTATSGPGRLRLSWRSDGVVPAYAIDRRTGNGPFVPLGSIPFSVGGGYEFVDVSPTPGTLHTYLVSESWNARLRVPRATVDGSAYSTALPPNVVRAGPSGVASIQAAISAAPPATTDWVVTVEPGVYPAFIVDATAPQRLRIIGDGTGDVRIDTGAGPVQVTSRTAAQTVELAGLRLGDPATPQTALRIDGSAGVVIVDRVSVAAAVGSVGVDVRSSPKVAVQRSQIDAGTGLRMDGARVVATRTAVHGVDLINQSRLTTADIVNSGATTVDGTSVLEPLSGTAPDVESGVFTVPGLPSALALRGAPNASFALFVSFGHAWLEFPPIELPILMDLGSALQVGSAVADATGEAGLSIVIAPTSSALFGRSLVFQALVVDPASASIRTSTATTKIWMQ